MLLTIIRVFLLLTLTFATSSCATNELVVPKRSGPNRLSLTVLPDGKLRSQYILQRPVEWLSFERELDGYRAEAWAPSNPVYRWVRDGKGERLERSDGQAFDEVEFIIPIDYRALPGSYAPFSPFSHGGALIHSGQFHFCLESPCEAPVPLELTISAQGSTIGVGGKRLENQATVTSRDSGTNIFVGTLQPVNADGFIAIIDPGLPEKIRKHLQRSLPQAMNNYRAIYGPLSLTPELYVSINSRPEPRGRISTQGGVLPGQIFVHFDGEDAKKRASEASPLWLDWFFAHEAAHLYQQDGAGLRAFDTTVAWIHEGGADAMAALNLFRREDEAQNYAADHGHQAIQACESGLAETALITAADHDMFDLNYQCGLLIWLALDQELLESGTGNLHALNMRFLERVRGGQPWNEDVFLGTAIDLGVAPELISDIKGVSMDNRNDRLASLQTIASMAKRAMERYSRTDM